MQFFLQIMLRPNCIWLCPMWWTYDFGRKYLYLKQSVWNVFVFSKWKFETKHKQSKRLGNVPSAAQQRQRQMWSIPYFWKFSNKIQKIDIFKNLQKSPKTHRHHCALPIYLHWRPQIVSSTNQTEWLTDWIWEIQLFWEYLWQLFRLEHLKNCFSSLELCWFLQYFIRNQWKG